MPTQFNLSARRSKIADVRYLAERLRPADKAEVEATGRTPFVALFEGLHNSDPCLTITGPDNKPLAMFGTVPTADSKYRFIWLLGTEALVTTHRREFLRRSKAWIGGFHDKAPILGNFMHKANTVHRRWLEWVGCSFVGEREINGHLFAEFIHI